MKERMYQPVIMPQFEIGMKSAAKFKRTNKIINLNTNKSKYSGSETSSTKSFYIPQNKITDKFKRTNFVERQISFQLNQSRCSLNNEIGYLRLGTDPCLSLASEDKNSQIYQGSQTKKLVQELDSLKRHNDELQKKIQTLTETFDNHLKTCQIRNTNKMKTVINKARVQQLQDQNKKLQKEIMNMKEQIHQLKKSNDETKSSQLNFIEFDNTNTYKVRDEYIEKTQKNAFNLNEENKKLRLKIDFLNRKMYSDLEVVRKKKEEEYKILKNKYEQQVSKSKKTIRENMQLQIQKRRLQAEMIKQKGQKVISLSTKHNNLLQLSSQED